MDVTVVADTLGNAVCSQDQGHMTDTPRTEHHNHREKLITLAETITRDLIGRTNLVPLKMTWIS